MSTLKKLVNEVQELTTPSEETCNRVIENIRAYMRDYVNTHDIKSLVMGISGGLDSAVTAAIFQEEFTGVPLIGVSLPINSTVVHKIQATWVGETFCSNFKEVDDWEGYCGYGWKENDIKDVLSATDELAESAGFSDFPTDVLQGNMKARLRMITLYDLARKTNGLVLSTDNLSESQMGFWTINGDVGDLGGIQNIGKGFELPEIAKVLGVRDDIITQPASDGLNVTDANTDEAQLGGTYKEVDTIMGIYLGTLPLNDTKKAALTVKLFDIMAAESDTAKKVAKVIGRYEKSHFKRAGTINLTREEIGIDK